MSGLKEIELWGGSSVDDHGKFVFKNYIGDLPFFSADDFIQKLNEVIVQNDIDYIYPAMDNVVDFFARFSGELEAEVIGSNSETTNIALSKEKTYKALEDVIRCPRRLQVEELMQGDFPVFLKPEVGYGSIGVLLAKSKSEVIQALEQNPSLMVLEYLPGDEYTVDCFTDYKGKLQFFGARQRCRVARGISVNTVSVGDDMGEFGSIAKAINKTIRFNGAWFFQVKRTQSGELALLEVAPRIAGSMGLHRCKGVNLPLLSVFNQAGREVTALENQYKTVYDRAFYNRVRISHPFSRLYLDFDDCLLMDGKFLNPKILMLIAECRNARKPIILITRHAGDLELKLSELGVRGLIDEVIHLQQGEPKSEYMTDVNGFFVDDSFKERLEASAVGVASLGPESVEALLKYNINENTSHILS
ncbi:ATP-grasp domain-containing protein [Akkermansiaceae bacterium]|nr:ATP-grasp domain-containing protein [Akkermansiaceae bacterium]MDA7933546.1 ATP-grasp domain-containing protein [Akkermansiaceae bacterium]MDB4423428.1 ATP-grasp domain-containing protein [bacterium]